MEVTQNSTSGYNYCITGTALLPNVTKLRIFKINYPHIGVFSALENTNASHYALKGNVFLISFIVVLTFCSHPFLHRPLAKNSNQTFHTFRLYMSRSAIFSLALAEGIYRTFVLN